ncbi:MAG: hypothetical protein MHPSP_000920 [Paramarteilia canceri]
MTKELTKMATKTRKNKASSLHRHQPLSNIRVRFCVSVTSLDDGTRVLNIALNQPSTSLNTFKDLPKISVCHIKTESGTKKSNVISEASKQTFRRLLTSSQVKIKVENLNESDNVHYLIFKVSLNNPQNEDSHSFSSDYYIKDITSIVRNNNIGKFVLLINKKQQTDAKKIPNNIYKVNVPNGLQESAGKHFGLQLGGFGPTFVKKVINDSIVGEYLANYPENVINIGDMIVEINQRSVKYASKETVLSLIEEQRQCSRQISILLKRNKNLKQTVTVNTSSNNSSSSENFNSEKFTSKSKDLILNHNIDNVNEAQCLFKPVSIFNCKSPRSDCSLDTEDEEADHTRLMNDLREKTYVILAKSLHNIASICSELDNFNCPNILKHESFRKKVGLTCETARVLKRTQLEDASSPYKHDLDQIRNLLSWQPNSNAYIDLFNKSNQIIRTNDVLKIHGKSKEKLFLISTNTLLLFTIKTKSSFKLQVVLALAYNEIKKVTSSVENDDFIINIQYFSNQRSNLSSLISQLGLRFKSEHQLQKWKNILTF